MATSQAEITDIQERRDADALREERGIQLWQRVGATKLANQLAAALTSQSMEALADIRDQQYYLATQFPTFRDFMDSHPQSPMSYDQFNRREKLLQTEGPEAFDLLNSLNVPLKARHLLKGEIEIDGDEIRVGEARVRKDDEAAILNLITRQHAKLLEQDRTLVRAKKDFDKEKRLRIEAEKRAVIANPDGTETGQALLTAAGATAKLRDALAIAPPEEKQAIKDQIFQWISHAQLELSAALEIIDKSEAAKAEEENEGEDLLED